METKKCPYCGEEILAAAQKCKHCGEWLENASLDCEITQSSSNYETREGFFRSYFWSPFVKHYADFSGKMNRKEYWMYCFILYFLRLVISCVAISLHVTVFFVAYVVSALVFFLPALSAMVRRLHDIGKSGWWYFIVMVPMVGPIWFLCLLCKRGEKTSIKPKWSMGDTIVVVSLTVLLLVSSLCIALKGTSEQYYVSEDADWTVNADFSYMLAIASTDVSDVDGTNPYIDRRGNAVIVKTDEIGGKLEPVISDVEMGIVGAYINLFPSTFDPNTIYFEYHYDGAEFSDSGKVDLETKKFELFDGEIIDMISAGTYEDCFLLYIPSFNSDGSLNFYLDQLQIVTQSKVGQASRPLAVFDIGDYFSRYKNSDVHNDSDFAAKVINWLEGQ